MLETARKVFFVSVHFEKNKFSNRRYPFLLALLCVHPFLSSRMKSLITPWSRYFIPSVKSVDQASTPSPKTSFSINSTAVRPSSSPESTFMPMFSSSKSSSWRGCSTLTLTLTSAASLSATYLALPAAMASALILSSSVSSVSGVSDCLALVLRLGVVLLIFFLGVWSSGGGLEPARVGEESSGVGCLRLLDLTGARFLEKAVPAVVMC